MKRKLLLIALAGALATAPMSCDTATSEKTGETENNSGIDDSVINKSEALYSGVEDQYIENPFLGSKWEYNTNSTTHFIYAFKTDGAVSCQHCCGLEFTNQFSYVMYKNWLVLCGSEMEEIDRLEVKSVHPTAEENKLDLINRNPDTGAITGSKTFVKSDVDDNPNNIGEDVTPPYKDFLGRWNGSDGNVYEFSDNGTYTVTPPGGAPVEYSYLVRKKTFVKVTHGETETDSTGAEVWKVTPVVTKTAFTLKDDLLTLGGVEMTKAE